MRGPSLRGLSGDGAGTAGPCQETTGVAATHPLPTRIAHSSLATGPSRLTATQAPHEPPVEEGGDAHGGILPRVKGPVRLPSPGPSPVSS